MKIRCLYLLITCLLAFACQPEVEQDPGIEISLPAGFEATLLYSPSEHDQGSWVSLTTDPQGRLIASDQYGGLYRVTLPEQGNQVAVETIPIKLGSAQGLLWAFDALYVSVNAREDSVTKGSGLYRVTDSDGDDQLDTVEKLFDMEGNGEHGPHGLKLGPEGNDLYLIAGNHTDVPEGFGSILSGWQEDQLFPPVLDPGGHANDRLAPGGWIARSEDQGQTWEVIASGFRNAYDIDFNQQGELFTFDSDMEWDLGSPWYRPIRVCHVIPGAEFGWRTGSGKWAAYYPDNLPGVVNIGQGSPTGVVFGTGASFPAEYQKSRRKSRVDVSHEFRRRRAAIARASLRHSDAPWHASAFADGEWLRPRSPTCDTAPPSGFPRTVSALVVPARADPRHGPRSATFPIPHRYELRSLG
jgi:hypothetical protein